jgi:hypothetical protein
LNVFFETSQYLDQMIIVPPLQDRPMVSLRTSFVCALLLTGCVSFDSSTVRLSIEAKPQGSGSFALQGEARLADRTKVIIQGLRRLPRRQGDRETPPHYAILGRTLAEIDKGRWTTTLNLLQPGAQAIAQESWQQPAAGLADQVDPDSEVQFMVLTQPRYNSDGLEEQLQAVKADRTIGQVYYTDDGRWYLQQQVNVAVALPSGSVSPQVGDGDRLWGSNSQVLTPPTPTSAKPIDIKSDTVPLTPAQRMH